MKLEMTLSEFISMLGSEIVLFPLIAGLLISVCSALIGTSLVEKRYSMIGDGLSHFGFLTMAIAIFFGVGNYMAISLPLVMIAAFVLLRIKENSKIKADSAIAIIATASLALGTLILRSAKGANFVTDVCNSMFGNKTFFGMTNTDFIFSVSLSVILIVLFVLFYNKFFAVTYDENFASASGVKTGLFNTLLALMVAVIIVIGMRLMGAMLISSLIIFPSLSSKRVFKRYRQVIVSSSVISVVCYLAGFVFSCLFGLAPGATIVVFNMIVFIFFVAIGEIRNRTSKSKSSKVLK